MGQGGKMQSYHLRDNFYNNCHLLSIHYLLLYHLCSGTQSQSFISSSAENKVSLKDRLHSYLLE